jgi:hypothetical protein
VSDTVWVERVVNTHVHSTRSDGTGTVEEIAHAAAAAGVDAVAITDHNAYGPDEPAWYGRTLVLPGEEINDPGRPHVNHLLVLGGGRDLSPFAGSLQGTIDAARRAGGLAVIAHPNERSGRAAREPVIDWVDRSVTGLNGIEIWNTMSEFKSYVHTLLHGLLYALAPALAIRGPYPETLALWDTLLAREPVYAHGGADAHANTYGAGPIRRVVFPYRYLFSAVNTHVLLNDAWSGDAARDARSVLDALAGGQSFVGYDRPAPTHGTRLTAERGEAHCTFGERLEGTGPAWINAMVPAVATLRLLRNGVPVRETRGDKLSVRVADPGVYRFEAWRRFRGHRTGWVFGNPIWVD